MHALVTLQEKGSSSVYLKMFDITVEQTVTKQIVNQRLENKQ